MSEKDFSIEQLEQLLFQPKKVEVDDKTVEQHDLDEVKALADFLFKAKAAKSRSGGLKITKLQAGGAP